MRTSALAALFGVHQNTVRLYEEWGYLPPIPRDASGQRVFTEQHVAQMRLARRALHDAPRSGPQFREAYKEIVWLSCAGQAQSAITQAHKHLEAVALARERAQGAREFVRRAPPELAARIADKPLHIRQAAAYVGETVPVLRRWEASGVVRVPRNPSNNYRTFGAEELGWLLVMRSLRLAGQSMASCRKLIEQHRREGRLPGPRPRAQGLDNALADCIALFAEHERHTGEVIEQLRGMAAPV